MKTIELYVKCEEQLKPPPDGSYADYAYHPCQAKYNITKILSPTESKALEMLETVAKEKGVKLKVYDVTTFRGKLKAFSRRIKNTPCIVIGARKVGGSPNKEELLQML